MFKGLSPINYRGREVWPLVEGGKGVSATNHASSGAWAAAGGIGTVSAVNADSYDPEGRIIQVLERAHSQVVGTLQRGKRFGFVVPDNKRLGFDVYVPEEDLKQAEEGQKVVVAIADWGDGTFTLDRRSTVAESVAVADGRI